MKIVEENAFNAENVTPSLVDSFRIVIKDSTRNWDVVDTRRVKEYHLVSKMKVLRIFTLKI